MLTRTRTQTIHVGNRQQTTDNRQQDNLDKKTARQQDNKTTDNSQQQQTTVTRYEGNIARIVVTVLSLKRLTCTHTRSLHVCLK